MIVLRSFWLMLGVVILCAAAVSAASQLDTEQTAGEIRYVCTGIGETKGDPRWSRYPVKLMFADAKGDLISDVEIVLTDNAGREVLRTSCASPWLLLYVPSGGYKVTASSGGKQVTGSFALAGSRSGQMTLGLGFPG